MTVLLYAIVAADAPLPVGGTGLQQRPLRTVETNGLCALISEVEELRNDDVAEMLRYEEVIERLLAEVPALLPARFGTVALTEDAVRDLVADRAPQLRRALQQVDGAVEFAVRAPSGDEQAGPPAPAGSRAGTAYMQALLDRRRTERRLRTAVAGLFRSRRSDGAGRSTSYLVDRANAPEFTARLHELGATVTGPWPPYSFVQGEAA